jgi:hypothetical protein
VLVGAIDHRTLGEALRDYFQHPEWKAGDPQRVGLLPRRHVIVAWPVAIGKESNALSLLTAEETDGALGGTEAGIDGAQVFDQGTLQEALSRWSATDLARMTGVKRSTIRDLQTGKTARPRQTIQAALLQGLSQPHRQSALPCQPDVRGQEDLAGIT